MKLIDRVQFLRAGLRGLVAPVSLGVQAIATDAGGRVLLVRHTYRPGWYLPGGGVMRGETAEHVIVRELVEETGLVKAGPPALFGFYLRKVGGHCDYIAVYALKDAATAFLPSLEIAELCAADPAAPPHGTSDGARRRLAEYTGAATADGYW